MGPESFKSNRTLSEPSKDALTAGKGDLDLDRDLQKFQKQPNLISTSSF